MDDQMLLTTLTRQIHIHSDQDPMFRPITKCTQRNSKYKYLDDGIATMSAFVGLTVWFSDNVMLQQKLNLGRVQTRTIADYNKQTND